jgi:hypothetical protein
MDISVSFQGQYPGYSDEIFPRMVVAVGRIGWRRTHYRRWVDYGPQTRETSVQEESEVANVRIHIDSLFNNSVETTGCLYSNCANKTTMP